jgi:cytochrome c oxidase subunit II
MIARGQRRRLCTGLLVALGLVAGGCSFDTPLTTAHARSDFARDILGLYGLITWITVGIAVVVCAALIWILLRFRERPGAPMPRQIHGHTGLEILWIVVPALLLVVIAVPTAQITFRTQRAAPPEMLDVTVRAWQWWWEFRYPTLGVVTANELHLPVDRPVRLRLEGPDIIHSFWVPLLGGKRDVIPGRTNWIVMTPDTPGEYRGLCAEFCGASHANMRFRVFVREPEAFERWVEAQRAPAVEPRTDDEMEGRSIYARSACVACHTIRDVSTGVIGPDLTHFGSRRRLAADMFDNTADNVTAFLLDPDALKPGVKMPALGLTEAQARAVAAYLLSLE